MLMFKWVVMGVTVLFAGMFFGTFLLTRHGGAVVRWWNRNKKLAGWGFLIVAALAGVMAIEKYLFPALPEAAIGEPEPLQWVMLHPLWTITISLVVASAVWGFSKAPKAVLWTTAGLAAVAALGVSAWFIGSAPLEIKTKLLPLDLVQEVLHNPLPVIFLVGFPLAILQAFPKVAPIINKIGKGFAWLWVLIFMLAGLQLFWPAVFGLPPNASNTCRMPYRLGVVYRCTLTDTWTPALPTEGSTFPADAKFCYSFTGRTPPQWEKLLTEPNTFRWRSKGGPMDFYYGLIQTSSCPPDLSTYRYIERR